MRTVLYKSNKYIGHFRNHGHVICIPYCKKTEKREGFKRVKCSLALWKQSQSFILKFMGKLWLQNKSVPLQLSWKIDFKGHISDYCHIKVLRLSLGYCATLMIFFLPFLSWQEAIIYRNHLIWKHSAVKGTGKMLGEDQQFENRKTERLKKK